MQKPRTACSSLYRNLGGFTCQCTFSLTNFIANNQEDFRTKSFVYKITTSNKSQLHKETSKFTRFHNRVVYASNKFFNSLPLRLTIGMKMHNLK